MSQFNQGQFGTFLFGTDAAAAPSYSTDTVVFDSHSLSDGTTYFVKDKPDSMPSRDVVGGDIPRDHGRFITADYFREKTIEVTGFIKTSDFATLKTAMDNLKRWLRRRERTLDITEGSTVRRYTATCINTEQIFEGHKGNYVSYCPFIIRFACKTPFATDRDYTATTLTFTTTQSLTAINAGTAPAKPIIVVIFDSASSVTALNVKRLDSDGSTMEEIEYSGSMAAGDVLIFDGEERTVTKNSTGVNFTGSFLQLDPGSYSIQFTVTGTSFSAIATEKHKNSYL